jgi:hypothetical protein
MGLFSTAVISQVGPVIPIEYLIVGGGGAAQAFDSTRACGGGGAGGFLSGSYDFTVGFDSPYIQVGYGGPRTFAATVANGEGADGGSSTAFGLTAYGGGGGGNSSAGSGTYTGPGRAGGSGGGGGARRNNQNTQINTSPGGVPVSGQGFAGGQSWSRGAIDGASYLWRAGSGGGASSAATSGSLGNSDPGTEKAWLDGTNYAGGGGAYPASIQYASSGSGGRVQFNTTIGTEGYNGIVKVRYTGSVALFQGGNVAISGGYVYHTFLAPTQTPFTGSNGNYTFYYTGG